MDKSKLPPQVIYEKEAPDASGLWMYEADYGEYRVVRVPEGDWVGIKSNRWFGPIQDDVDR